jgi:hypothetical protein
MHKGDSDNNNNNVTKKGGENIVKYKDLSTEIQRMKVWHIPVLRLLQLYFYVG